MVSTDVRAELLLADAEIETMPLPLPEVPPVMVTQASGLDAVHAHPAVVTTLNEAVPPGCGNDVDVGTTV
jgi:hypothetical protein